MGPRGFRMDEPIHRESTPHRRNRLPLTAAWVVTAVMAVTILGILGASLLAFSPGAFAAPSSGAFTPVNVHSSAPTGYHPAANLKAVTFGPAKPVRSHAGAVPGLCSTTCAMGITDYGVTPSGASYTYNTHMVESFADVSKFTIGAANGGGCLDANAADCMTLQSNWVTKGVQEQGFSGEYWMQDVPEIGYDSSCSSPCVSGTYSVTFLDNIWNLSYSSICPLGHGHGCMNAAGITGNGTGSCTSYGGAPTFYYCVGATTYGLTLPFTVWTFMSISPGSGTIYGPCASNTTRSCVDFYMSVSEGGSIVVGGYFDSVAFKPGSHGAGAPVFHVANASMPYGLPYDGEWDFCGPGGGSSVSMTATSVNMQTFYWGPAASWQSIKHAWSSGSDTAETASGVAMWSWAGFRDTAQGNTGTDNPQVSLW